MINPLEAFYNYGIKQTGTNKYQCRCTAHEDRSPSLTITVTPEKILLHCFAGCEVQDIIESIGYTVSDLFPPNDEFTADYREKKQEQFNQRQFMTDYQIVYLIECDLKKGKSISDYDKKLAAESFERLKKHPKAKELYKELTNEEWEVAKFNSWIKRMAFDIATHNDWKKDEADKLETEDWKERQGITDSQHQEYLKEFNHAS